MSRDAVKTLFHPFATATLPLPQQGERVLFLGAEAGPPLPDGFAGELIRVQPFRPLYRALPEEALTEAEGEDYDIALILLNKHRGDNENRIAEALRRVRAGGLIVIAGGKEDGVQTVRNLLLKLGLVLDSMPKYHGLALFLTRPRDCADAIQTLEKRPVTVDGRFTAAPGLFSHDRIDAGSELLASRLPEGFEGNAADFGAGWGYLSVMLAEKSPRVNRIDLYEADWRALQFSRENLARNCPKIDARFFWHDLAAEPVKDRYDLIVMNPPFHEAQAADPEIGRAMIRAAATALKNGGRLLMVANRGLPYEPVLSENFREAGETCRNARFKVLQARK